MCRYMLELHVDIGLTSDDHDQRFTVGDVVGLAKSAGLDGHVIPGVGLFGGEIENAVKFVSRLGWEKEGGFDEACGRLNAFLGSVFGDMHQCQVDIVYRWLRGKQGWDVIVLRIGEKTSVKPADFSHDPLIGADVPRITTFGTSTFKIDQLLSCAHSSIFLGGQNFYSLVVEHNRERFQTLFNRFLSNGPDRVIKILISRPDLEYAVRTWSAVIGDKFPKHLTKAVSVFRHWQKIGSESWGHRLDIRMTVLLPVGLTFIDAEIPKQGIAVVTPVLDKNADWRPSFVIHAETDEVTFNYYWHIACELFEDKGRTVRLREQL